MKIAKKTLSIVMAVLMLLSCWVWVDPSALNVNAAEDSSYLFAYFTGTSIEGQTIHLAISKDGLNYTALRDNKPVIIPSKGTGCVRDPYLWYNENDGYYYILATDLDFTDTGSDYSDNSESFIVWRSKDLINWHDETMIDVKAILGRLGINNNNMQAVWAPQVLWDGTEFVVYFSLQCDATSNGSWNPLTIVYLKTTNLLDESKYHEYGVIHNPGRHVIDADIIKKPNTNQYYMFYKDEAAGGGIQNIFYLVSDNGPTGPYYAPNGTNGGRGPQLFSWVGQNLEGCNSFFDDNGDLVTFVDEYDYKNANGQKEAHFHVSKTSDFVNYTKVDENSYNINSLSPRHGSVIKISNDKYAELAENSSSISSSSFPETETPADHLVGRYFTTDNAKYNAVTKTEDLKITDNGSINMHLDSSGNYYAEFAGAGAEINLAEIIVANKYNPQGDLNINDGFTITFTATTPTDTAPNTRFFDISNNWSQRGDIPANGAAADECYLHMSPVAVSNGLYVGAYNGPATTGSWTWASQGQNYNDGYAHEYIITFADGNMILYIDGALAMKRNRFNMNTEYGDNFLTDTWYKEIGNSKMRIGKSEWSDPLFTGNIQNLCIYDCTLSYYDVEKMQKQFDIAAGDVTLSRIVVPETVYMTPSTGTSTKAQYYVNNTLDLTNKIVDLEVSPSNTAGNIEFYIPGAIDAKIEVTTVSFVDDNKDKVNDLGDVVLAEAGATTGSYEGNSLASLIKNGHFVYRTAGLYIDTTGDKRGLYHKENLTAEWKFTITMSDGSTQTYYAYSTLYAPYYHPVGASTWCKSTSPLSTMSSALWIDGVHGYTASTVANASPYYPRTDTFLPMTGPFYSSGFNNRAFDQDWVQSGSNGLDPTVAYRSGGSGSYHRSVSAVSPVANITVDTSRYNNLNQIPNVKIGFMITSSEGTKEGSWYVSNYTGNVSNGGADGGDKEEVGSNDFYNNKGAVLKSGEEKGCTLKFHEALSIGISDVTLKGAARGESSGSLFGAIKTSAWNTNYLQIDVTDVNKKALRNLVFKASYIHEQNYTAETFSGGEGSYKAALRNAADAVGNPSNSTLSSYQTALQNALDNLKTPVTLNFNYGNTPYIETDTTNYKVGTAETFTYNLPSSIPDALEREGYTFMGWSTDKNATTGSTAITTGLKPTFYAVWAINSTSLNDDRLVMDFDNFVFDPFENDTVFMQEVRNTGRAYELLGFSANGSSVTKEYLADYSKFTVKDDKIVYKIEPAKIYTNIMHEDGKLAYNSIWYHASITGNDNIYNPIYKSFEVAPASNVLFEDTRFTKAKTANNTGTPWTATGTSADITHDADNVYGYNSSYEGNIGEYSNGTALVTTVDENNKRSQIQSFSFTGTGFDLYGQCGANTGIMVITVKDSEGNAVKASVVDTYYNDSTYDSNSTLNQITIAGARDLPHDTYTVQVAAMYMSIAGAVKGAQNAYGLRDMVSFASPMSTADMLYEALCEVDLEEVFEVDDLEINWFDEGSVLNGGNGASTYALGDEGQTAATRTATTLVNVIDSIRVYNPLNPEFADNYYVASEKGAKYFNVMDNLDNNGIVSGNGTFTYVNYDPGAENDQATITLSSYDTKGSNEEFYLTSNITNGLVFTVKKPDAASRVMISLRAAAGSPVAKIGSKVITLNSSTEMYYDITEYLGEGGTVAIQNNGDGLLAIGNVKVTNCAAEPVMMSTFNMRSARMMMMAPPAADEPEVEETTTEEVTTEETTTEEVATEEATSEEATTEETTTEEVTTEETTTEAPSTEEPTTPDADEDNNEETKESFLEKINGVIDFIVSLIKKIFSAIDFMQNL